MNQLQQVNEHVSRVLEAFRVAGDAMAERMRAEIVPLVTQSFEELHNALTPTERKTLAQAAMAARGEPGH